MNKTFRGRIADGGIERIRLSTNNGLKGYRIAKFQIMGHTPGNSSTGSYEHILQIFTKEPTTASATVDFTDPTLIAAGLNFAQTSPQFDGNKTIIFDSMVFNQDIFVSHVDEDSAQDANYYLELEQVSLSKDEATVATLKDMRAGPDTNFGP